MGTLQDEPSLHGAPPNQVTMIAQPQPPASSLLPTHTRMLAIASMLYSDGIQYTDSQIVLGLKDSKTSIFHIFPRVSQERCVRYAV